MFKATLAQFNPGVFFDDTFFYLGLDEKDFRFMMVAIVILLAIDILKEKGIGLRKITAKQNIVFRWGIYYVAFLS